jgi:hypothetical protein
VKPASRGVGAIGFLAASDSEVAITVIDVGPGCCSRAASTAITARTKSCGQHENYERAEVCPPAAPCRHAEQEKQARVATLVE